VQVKEVDGRMRYVVHGELHPWIPGPGDANPRPKWVASVLKVLRRLSPRNEATRGTDLVAQFHEHVWVAPFVEDSVPALIEHMPVERILFGSDYPHAEGFAEPKEFFAKVADLSIDDQRKIMRDNARELTFT
jgi:predicted TIM-barrel fold metal-dependent hydrolase